MIKVKTVSDKFWILKDNNSKIGEVSAINNSYTVNVGGNRTIFKTLEALKIKTGINLLESTVPLTHSTETCVYEFPVAGNRFNAVWNLKLKLPLYTKQEDSKSWFAAGYYLVHIKGKWKTILSPKLIIIQRNEYLGPYKTTPTYNDPH